MIEDLKSSLSCLSGAVDDTINNLQDLFQVFVLLSEATLYHFVCHIIIKCDVLCCFFIRFSLFITYELNIFSLWHFINILFCASLLMDVVILGLKIINICRRGTKWLKNHPCDVIKIKEMREVGNKTPKNEMDN